MKEIGGYFGLEELINNPYYKNMIEINTGRNALIYLVKARNIERIYLPYYLCDSVSNVLDINSIKYSFYNIDKNFMPIFEQDLLENEFIYIVNYYGQITNNIIEILKEKYKNIIIDNTHAFFQEPIESVDTIYSCRKFFGVPDGAYLSTKSILEEELETDVSNDRMCHILGRYEGKASDYYKVFQENDVGFKELKLKKMSRLTKNILGAIDYEKVKNIRNENYNYLHKKLGYKNKLKIKDTEASFAYPFYIENGIVIRKELAKKNIYIPTLWPNVLINNYEGSVEYDYTANILPLPCDQRYGIGDMDIVVEQLISL